MVLGTMVGLSACGGDVPQAPMTSYETVTIKKENITVPVKFSAKLKGETDVTITPQVSGQLMRICVTEGDVNEAIADCLSAREKHDYYHRQVEVLHEAYLGTHELMDNGKASYLEVLTAQESLLSAQLNEAANLYNGSQAVISLYIALGGGTK